MSQHSMRRGSDGKPQPLLQIAKPLLHVVGPPLLLGERVTRVVVGHREQIDAVTALGEEERHLVPGAIREPLGDAVHALGLARKNDLVGDEHDRGASVSSSSPDFASDEP